MLNANGPGFKGLYAGDVVEFSAPKYHPMCSGRKRAAVNALLVFPDHVVVTSGRTTTVVNADNFVRLVRRGKRHMLADKEMSGAALRREVCDNEI